MNDAPTVLCYGDSNTHSLDVAMFGRLGRTVRWPGVLAAELGPSAAVVEEGLNGRTTIWDDPFEEGRSGRAYLGPCLASHAPVGVLVIMLGTNDSKLSFHLGATEIANGAGALVDLALRSGSGPDGGPPAVLLVAPPLLGPATAYSELWGFGMSAATVARLASLYRLVAETAGIAFLDAGPIATVDPEDGVHLDERGHRALGLAVADAVRPLLAGRS